MFNLTKSYEQKGHGHMYISSTLANASFLNLDLFEYSN